MSLTTSAIITHITPLTDSILELTLLPETYIPYEAGQYLEIMIQGEGFYFSIANAPLGARHYTLHIRHRADNPLHERLIVEIKTQGTLTIRLPYGKCNVRVLNPSMPILFIAAGTGFAPIHAMIEQLLSQGDARAFDLFWTARAENDLYMNSKLCDWQTHVAHFRYFHYLSTQNTSFFASILKMHSTDLPHWQAVIAGPHDMAIDMKHLLLQQGMLNKNIFSDAF